jgi:hypothetical protein
MVYIIQLLNIQIKIKDVSTTWFSPLDEPMKRIRREKDLKKYKAM